jgi:hypothetical protein
MDLPVVSTGYCEELHSRLEELLGTDTVAVHQELGLGLEPPAESPVTMPLEAAPIPDAGPANDASNESAPEIKPETVAVAEPPLAETTEDNPPKMEAPGPSDVEEPAPVAAEASIAVGAEAAGDEPPF